MRPQLNSGTLGARVMKGRWTLAALLGFDLLTKLLALVLLPASQSVQPDALVQVVLRTNSLGIGTWGQALSAYSGLADRAAAGLGMAAVGVLVVSTRRSESSRLWKVVAVLGCYFTVSIVARLWLRGIETIPMPVGVGLMRLGAATLFSSIWWLTPPGWWRLATALLAASAMGNFASVLLPPHEIVDFLYSRLVARSLGWGVFNAADVYYLAGGLVLAMAFIRALVQRVRARLASGA
jgi:lipoprotein signal peptidase